MKKPRGRSLLTGEGVRARAVRGSALTVMNLAGHNLLRLASNLILTRLLFPEAFGMMALVQVFITGLEMFSDLGIKSSIIQHARGDDPDFLNTAWTLQILRGGVLWGATALLALPAAWIYDTPMLAQLLPVAGLNALITGFQTTNLATANRHLRLGRQTMVQLGSQALGIVVMVALAWLMQSVWALVIGGLIGNLFKVAMLHVLLPGIRNRLHWEPAAFRALIGFGGYIFLATVAGFIINQGDRAILGGFIPLAELGVYNIGLFLGVLPVTLGKTIANKVIFPLYRLKPPSESPETQRQVFRARRLVALTGLGLGAVLAWSGPWLIELMYDPRYHGAGAILVLVSLAAVPQATFAGYDPALLANGDSRRFFLLLAATALMQTLLLFAGLRLWGLGGAILAPGLAALAAYPLRWMFLRRYAANDNPGDAALLAAGLLATGLAVWFHADRVATLFL